MNNIKEDKQKLEKEILELIKTFEKKYECYISALELLHQQVSVSDIDYYREFKTQNVVIKVEI